MLFEITATSIWNYSKPFEKRNAEQISSDLMNRPEMNRPERRQKGIKEHEKCYMMKLSDIERIKQEATERATNTAFTLMLGIPLVVLNDKYSKITKKYVDGKSRLERFTEMCLFEFECFNEGRIGIDDFNKILWDECGIKIENDGGEKPYIVKRNETKWEHIF